jgi:7-keto-8-aminopelargonate synthetase-like enzyme
MINHLTQQARQGVVLESVALAKMTRASAVFEANYMLLQEEIKRRNAAEQLDREVRSSKKRTRFPHGHVYDQTYQVQHAEELAARKARETESKRKKGRVAAVVPSTSASASLPVNPAHKAGPSYEV